MTVTEVVGGKEAVKAALETLATGNKVVYAVVEPEAGYFYIYHDT